MLFEKVVNPEVNLIKRDVDHLFFDSDFPLFGRKPKLFEARNCYISIAYVDDITDFTDDKDTINKLKNKNVYFVQFAKTIDILGDKKGTIVVDGVYENFIDEMDGAIKYLNDYLCNNDVSIDDSLSSVEIWDANTNSWQAYDCPPAENGETIKSYADWCINEQSDYWATVNSASDKIRLNGWYIVDGANYYDDKGNLN